MLSNASFASFRDLRYEIDRSLISIHLPLLEYFASQCTDVVEFGTWEGYQTIAFISGAKGTVYSYDESQTKSQQDLVELAKKGELPCRWKIFNGKSDADPLVAQVVPSCDLMFFNGATDEALKLHSSKCRKWLVFNNTNVESVRNVIRGQIQTGKWKMVYSVEFGGGLSMLERNEPLALDYDHVTEAMRHIKPDCAGTDVYEFGVLFGNTLMEYLPQLQTVKPVRKVFGFDSFKGLPHEAGATELDKDWYEGNFNATFDGKPVKDVMDGIKNRLLPFNVTLIPGFYEESLRPFIVRGYNMGPAYFVHLDCDLYTSTYQALDFLFENNIPVENTIFRYDDWRMTAEEFTGGQSLSHKRITAKYNLRWERLSMNVFRLKSYIGMRTSP